MRLLEATWWELIAGIVGAFVGWIAKHVQGKGK